MEISNTDIGNKEFYAKWNANIYAVTLNPNAGTIASGKDITSYTYGNGATLPTSNDMTREGYTFEGWYADSLFSGAPVTEINSTDMGNKEFYAKWTRNTTPIIPGDTVNYIVEHYKAGNNSYMLEETEKLGDKIGANVTAEPKIYTGYTYNPDVAGSVTSGTLKKISSAADIVTLKLYYDLTVYNVTVENDGNGSASAAPASATMGGKITLTVTPNSGYRFKEWQIVSGSVAISGDTFTMPAENVTVADVSAVSTVILSPLRPNNLDRLPSTSQSLPSVQEVADRVNAIIDAVPNMFLMLFIFLSFLIKDELVCITIRVVNLTVGCRDGCRSDWHEIAVLHCYVIANQTAADRWQVYVNLCI
jgi:uncharacterized repeat protein (TIGR02543 family)